MPVVVEVEWAIRRSRQERLVRIPLNRPGQRGERGGQRGGRRAVRREGMKGERREGPSASFVAKVNRSKRCAEIQLKGMDDVVAFGSFTGVFPASCFPPGPSTPWESRSAIPTNNFPSDRATGFLSLSDAGGRAHVVSLSRPRGSIQSPRAKRLLESYLLSRLMGLRASRKLLLQFFTRLSLRNSIRFQIARLVRSSSHWYPGRSPLATLLLALSPFNASPPSCCCCRAAPLHE